MKVKAIKCPKCGNIIYSRTRYDCRKCSCGNCFVDGGFDYCRYGYSVLYCEEKPKVLQLEIKATKKELHDDWSNRTNKYGLILEKGKSRFINQ